MKEDNQRILRVLSPGLGSSLQDRGRVGWRRWGVPSSGPMDAHSALCANRLLDNPANCAVAELLLHGSRWEVLQPAWLAICGADITCTIPTWRAHLASPGEIIAVKHCAAGMWSYLAVEGGFAGERLFGSVSYYARGAIGRALDKGTVLEREAASRFRLPHGVAGRIGSWTDRWNFADPPRIRLYPGPQWKSFSIGEREKFLTAEWKVSPQSDRVGYRLEGPTVRADPVEIVSEPVRIGSIQIPENGQPIVTMPDGPTVGGYPKIGWIDNFDLPWMAQCRPGQTLRFQLVS